MIERMSHRQRASILEQHAVVFDRDGNRRSARDCRLMARAQIKEAVAANELTDAEIQIAVRAGADPKAVQAAMKNGAGIDGVLSFRH